ncbi:hypothetical protein [Paraburkholderia hospita]|uniref:hypothetical protein n=1 Tax=Paraburkholderia hospita TaxID=169430 RepID=UPI002368798A|nr:hypothetical protein [Paraburkholderia hospita]
MQRRSRGREERTQTDRLTRASVRVGMAVGAWRMLTRPGFAFDEGRVIATKEFNQISRFTSAP